MSAAATPAIEELQLAGVSFELHRFEHERGVDSFALEAVNALGIDPARVLKTLVLRADGELVVAMVPATRMLPMKVVARTLGAKRVSLAPARTAESATGYTVGGISPFGQRRRLDALLADSALEHPTVFVSAGRRGLEIELAPADLVRVTGARLLPLRA